MPSAKETGAPGTLTGDSGLSAVTLGTLEAQIQKLADTLSEALHDRSALEQLILETHAAATKQRAALESSLDEHRAVQSSQKREIDELRADSVQSANAFDAQIRALTAEAQSLEEELKAVKRKYRGAQHSLAKERDRLRRAQERLAQAEASLSRIRGTAIFHAYFGAAAAARRLIYVFRRPGGMLPSKQRLHRVNLIRNSPQFDAKWYLSRYSDVATAGIDPAVHYLEHGWREGRDPSPSFSTSAYLKANADVGSANLNPLLHYVEFGLAEGRSLPDGPRLAANLATGFNRDFGPPAPCASFPITADPPIRWLRAARLRDAGGDVLILGGQGIGIVEGPAQRQSLTEAYSLLAALSGHSPRMKSASILPETGKLVDAWYVADGRLRSRWTADGPLVVRAYQVDEADSAALKMVGEGLATTSLDFVDAILRNPYFPVLFVLGTPQGKVDSVEVVHFPSLCRGGLHYPELLAMQSAEGQPFEIARASNALAERLLNILEGADRPLIAQLQVIRSGADGSEPIFRDDFQNWLSTVMKIQVRTVTDANLDRATDAVAGSTAPALRSAGGILSLPADSIPTIGALVAEVGNDDQHDPSDLSLIVAGSEPAQPATLIRYPPASGSSHAVELHDYPPAWPGLQLPPRGSPADTLRGIAIRQPRAQALTDAELLIPVAPPALPLQQNSKPVTWLVFPEDWEGDTLSDGLEALSLQDGEARLAIVGEAGRHADQETARALFGEEVRFYGDVFDVLDEIQTPLIGYLGAHVILHDRRATRFLAGMLDDPDAASASCVLVAAEKRGNSWSATIADPGAFVTPQGEELSVPVRADQAQLLWRTTYPALRPPRDLWLARASAGRGWLERAGPLRPGEGVHLCTSLVTASYVSEPNHGHAHIRPPAAAAAKSIRSEALIG